MINISKEEIRDKMFFVREENDNQPIAVIKIGDLMKFERQPGEWIKKVDDVGFISHICSKCGAEIELEDPCDNKFCFNCGTQMGGKNGLPLQKNDRNS